jgi:hypothetical protein
MDFEAPLKRAYGGFGPNNRSIGSPVVLSWASIALRSCATPRR